VLPFSWSSLDECGSGAQPSSSRLFSSVSPTQSVPCSAAQPGSAARPALKFDPESADEEAFDGGGHSVAQLWNSNTQCMPSDAVDGCRAADASFVALSESSDEEMTDGGNLSTVELRQQSSKGAGLMSEAARSLILPSPETRLYDALLEKLTETGDNKVMEKFEELCVSGKLKIKKPHGSAERLAIQTDDPYSLGVRVEYLLLTTKQQRSKHFERLRSEGDARANDSELVFGKKDMKTIMNEWRKEPETWMKEESLQKVNALENRKEYQRAVKSKFSTMLFELFGNKALVDLFIRTPICSVAQPASLLNRFIAAWQDVCSSEEATRAREISKRNSEHRLSKQIYNLRQLKRQAQVNATWVEEDRSRWYKLSREEQRLWYEYNDGTLEGKIASLQSQQHPRFPGTAERIAATSHFRS